jgi:WD40 repeat protein
MMGNESEQSGKSIQNGSQSHLTLLHTLKGHNDVVRSVAWALDGLVLASGSHDETIRLWDGQSGQLLHALEGHEDAVYSVAWSPDGRVLASGSDDNTIRLWDGQSGQYINTLEGHTDTVSCISFSIDGRLLASKSDDRTIRIWRTFSWETVGILEEASNNAFVESRKVVPPVFSKASQSLAGQVVSIFKRRHAAKEKGKASRTASSPINSALLMPWMGTSRVSSLPSG